MFKSFFEKFFGCQKNSSVSSVSVNGKPIRVPSGKSISVVNNQVYIDGVVYPLDGVFKLTIIVEGDSGEIKINNGTVKVQGSVNGAVNTGNGTVTVYGDVKGDVSSRNGDIKCRNVAGRVESHNGTINHM